MLGQINGFYLDSKMGKIIDLELFQICFYFTSLHH